MDYAEDATDLLARGFTWQWPGAAGSVDGSPAVATLHGLDLLGREQPFDLVLANIHAEVLVKLREPLKRAAAGGHLVLSGLLAEQGQLVQDSFAEIRLATIERIDDEGWCALVYRVAGAAASTAAGRRGAR